MKITSDKKGAFGFGALVKKTRNWFQFEYDYWWNDFRDTKYYEDFGIKPPGFKEKWRSLKYKVSNKIRIKLWKFKESFKWHVSCLLVFWKLPTALRRTMDGLCASESLHNETYKSLEDSKAQLETAIYYLADGSGEPDENTAYRETYKTIYGDDWLDHCPNKYLTEEESWDRAEIGYENSRLAMTGGPNCDYRDGELYRAKDYLKKNNFKSQFSFEFGEDWRDSNDC